MPSVTLKAYTQRGEWDGTSSADNKDFDGVKELLRSYDQLAPDEFVIAININFHEIAKGKMSDPEIVFFVAKIPRDHGLAGFPTYIAEQDKDQEIEARTIRMTSNLDDIFSLMKRFDMFFTPSRMNLMGRTLNIVDSFSS